MFYSSLESLDQTSGVMRPIDYAKAGEAYQPTFGEAGSAALWSAWDRTMGARWLENWQLAAAEREAIANGTAQVYANEEEYRASQYNVPDIKFTEGMTSERARMLKANYEKRKREQAILQGADENGSWLYLPVTFGAGVIGSIPDPINVATMLIPGGAVVKGGRLLGMTAKQAFKRSLTPGVIGTAAGANLASSAYAAWDLNPKGEHITTQDVFMDTMMGAVLGPLFHTGGTLIARRGIRSELRSIVGDLHQKLPDDLNIAAINDSIRTNNPEAYRAAGVKLEEWAGSAEAHRAVGFSMDDWVDMTGRTQDAMDYIRQRILPGDRTEIARWMEYALHKTANGEAVDMAPIMQTPQAQSTLKRLENIINEYRTVRQETPVVIDTIEAARIEINTLRDAAFKVENDFRLALTEQRKTSDLLELRKASEDAKNIASQVREVFSELDNLVKTKAATEADILRLSRKLLAARDNVRSQLGIEGIPRAHRVIGLWERAIARAEAKLTELDVRIKEELRIDPENTRPVAAERLDYSPAPRTVEAPQEPLQSAIGMSKVNEFEVSGIDMRTPDRPGTMISDIERNLGEITPEERAMLGELRDAAGRPEEPFEAYRAQDERINAVQKAALEDTSFVECIIEAGVLR